MRSETGVRHAGLRLQLLCVAIDPLTKRRVISSIRAQGGAADQQQQSVNRIRRARARASPQLMRQRQHSRSWCSLGTPHILLAAMPSAEAGVLRFVFSVSVPKCDNCACGVLTLNGVGGTGEVKMTVKM